MLKQYLEADTPFERGIRLLALVFLAAALLNALRAMTTAWGAPLLGPHDFRQTQTAITAYYLMQGGPWFAYETPVLGAPWSIPFELPLYQGIAALVAGSGLMPLDQAGRFVSIVFFLASLVPAWFILARLGFQPWQRMIMLALWLCSPIYLFWSRTFMIESAALFLSLCYLALAQRQLDKPGWTIAVAGLLAGALAGMVKITTWYAFVVAALMLWLWRRPWQSLAGEARKNLRAHAIYLGLFMALPTLMVMAWTRHADAIKSLNLSGTMITSSALSTWNFGNLEQRGFWPMFNLLDRSLTESLGASEFMLVIVFLGLLLGKRALTALAALGLFALSVYTFTNLHQVHNYYQYAVSLFLVFAIGALLVRGLEAGRLARVLALLALPLLAWMQLKIDWRMLENMGDRRYLEVAHAARDATRPDEVLAIFGADWSSVIPYYSERRALMDRFISRLPENPRAVEAVAALAPAKVGAGVFCAGARNDPGRMLRTIQFLKLDPEAVYSNDLCQIHRALKQVQAN
jgi:hypothetical protein